MIMDSKQNNSVVDTVDHSVDHSVDHTLRQNSENQIDSSLIYKNLLIRLNEEFGEIKY